VFEYLTNDRLLMVIVVYYVVFIFFPMGDSTITSHETC
jgi:hypothetical protein